MSDPFESSNVILLIILTILSRLTESIIDNIILNLCTHVLHPVYSGSCDITSDYSSQDPAIFSGCYLCL